MLPYRDPTVLAKQVATLDRLSNGRLLLGIGLGAYRDEFAAVRAHQANAHRGNMLDEYLELLIRLLDDNEAAVSLAGEYVSVEGVAMHPKPLQQPLPMYLPARGDYAYKRIARWGLMPMVPCANPTAPIEALRPFMEAAGKDMDALDIIVEGELHIGPTQEDAVKGYQHTTMGNFRTARCPPKARKSVETITGANWVGTVDHIVEKLSALREQGFRHFNILHLAADTVAERLEQMQLFAEEIMPRVRT
jgi:alkanesulfonate monooxygenase SsuD/methylene tetrahydromethanopterin reductase-like flavin-dependent oxidoreductase (luciferase family)